ncbi:MAG: hypothetical protein JWQ18_3443, partial [Conexibacter sp.]|nr:hypothetical protein [Conexibacter sp.]
RALQSVAMSTARASEPTAAHRAGARGLAASPWAWVVGLYLLAAAVHLVLALRSPLPVLFPDEFSYSHLARGLADGTGSDWRGQHISQSAKLYVYFITPAWGLFSSSVDAYHASKVLGTLALCAQLIPVWILARDLVGPRLALVPAALSVAGTWMLTSAETVTEALAFPLATAALCAAVLALRRPASRLGWLAFILLALATWARIQLAILVPALLLAFVLDVLRDPAHRAERWRAHRPYVVLAGALFAGLIFIALAAPGVTGSYGGFFDLRPSLHRILSKSGLQLLELVALGGFAPVLLAAGAACSRRAWRDDRTGPLLAVFWPAALATVAQSGFFLAGYPPALSAIDRYVTYALPLALVLATVLVSQPKLLSRTALAVAGVLSLSLLARPAVKMIGEERATWGISYRLDHVVGLGTGLGLALVALALLGVVALVRARGTLPVRAALAVAAATLLALVVQDQAAWWQMTKTGTSFRSTMPSDLEWVDHHATGPVALLAITQNAPQFDDIDFFNRKITQAYKPAAGIVGRAIQGKVCSLRFGVTGELALGAGCGPAPSRFLINDPSARLTFHDEVRSASQPDVGRLVELKSSVAPRARSLIVLPCPRRTPGYDAASPDIVPDDSPITCSRALTGALWLDGPAQVAITYRGGRKAQTVEAAGRRFAIAPGAETTIRFGAPQGYSQFVAQADWALSVGTPKVRSVTLTEDGATTPVA